MSLALNIDINKLSDYSGIRITDETDWTAINSSPESLTSIELYFYTTSTTSAAYTYEFSATDLSTFIANGEIDLTFSILFNRELALDNWYDVKMMGNSGDYVSNFAGFGTDAYITTTVNENINNLHTPEQNRGTIEQFALQRMFLDGLKYLDSSTINDRSIKWKKRYNALVRLNS